MHASADIRVLVVEAHDDSRTLLCDYLGHHDIECVPVTSIDAGIEALRTLQPDVVIVEWFSDRMTDAGLVAKLIAAANDAQPAVRIVVLSTVPRPADFPDVDAYMLKPATLDRLLATVTAKPRGS